MKAGVPRSARQKRASVIEIEGGDKILVPVDRQAEFAGGKTPHIDAALLRASGNPTAILRECKAAERGRHWPALDDFTRRQLDNLNAVRPGWDTRHPRSIWMKLQIWEEHWQREPMNFL